MISNFILFLISVQILISLNSPDWLIVLPNPANILKTSIAKKPVDFAHFATLHGAEIKQNVKLFVLWASTPAPMFAKLDNKDVSGHLS